MVTLSSTGSVKQLPRGAKNENGRTSKQAPGESYQGATTFFSMALAKTLLLFPTSFKRIDLFSFYVKSNDDETEFLFIFTTKRREWVCSSNYGAAEKTKNGKQYSPRDIETANRLSIESAK